MQVSLQNRDRRKENREERRRQRDHRDRDGSDVATSHGTPRANRSWKDEEWIIL